MSLLPAASSSDLVDLVLEDHQSGGHSHQLSLPGSSSKCVAKQSAATATSRCEPPRETGPSAAPSVENSKAKLSWLFLCCSWAAPTTAPRPSSKPQNESFCDLAWCSGIWQIAAKAGPGFRRSFGAPGKRGGASTNSRNASTADEQQALSVGSPVTAACYDLGRITRGKA